MDNPSNVMADSNSLSDPGLITIGYTCMNIFTWLKHMLEYSHNSYFILIMERYS